MTGKKHSAESSRSATAPNTNPARADLALNPMKARRMLLLHNVRRWSHRPCSADYIPLKSIRLNCLRSAWVMVKRGRKFCKKGGLCRQQCRLKGNVKQRANNSCHRILLDKEKIREIKTQSTLSRNV